MHAWDTSNTADAKGFERVITHTLHTLVLMEPWDDPRPPDRVWCLFEAYTTLAKGAPYEVVLGPKQQLELQLSLADRFTELEAIVNGIDVHLAEATVETDRVKTFAAIEQLPGGFEGLNANVRGALHRWLVQASEGVLHRTNPYRETLSQDSAAMAVEKAALGTANFKWLPVSGVELSALVENRPRLGPGLFLLGCLMIAVALYVKGLTNIEVCIGTATEHFFSCCGERAGLTRTDSRGIIHSVDGRCPQEMVERSLVQTENEVCVDRGPGGGMQSQNEGQEFPVDCDLCPVDDCGGTTSCIDGTDLSPGQRVMMDTMMPEDASSSRREGTLHMSIKDVNPACMDIYLSCREPCSCEDEQCGLFLADLLSWSSTERTPAGHLTVTNGPGVWTWYAMLAAGALVAALGYYLVRHQTRRQLRRPPLFGRCVTRSRHCVLCGCT